MPFFSVVIPLYNKEHYIKETIDSVLNQTFKDFEIIIINDGSTDRSLDIIKKYDLKNLTIVSQKNSGLSASRNKGFSFSNGKVVAFLDADDCWLPNYLETIKSLYENFPEASIYGSGYFEKRGDLKQEISVNIDSKLKNKSFLINDFFQINIKQFIPCQSTIVLKKESFTPPIYNETLTYHEDIDFYLQYCTKYKVAICYKPLAEINFGSNNSMSSSTISDKKTPDLDYYQELYKDNLSILRYIDLQRYKYIIKYKYEKNTKLKEKLLKKIDTKSLSFLQKLMIKMPLNILSPLRRIKFFLLKYKIRLTTN